MKTKIIRIGNSKGIRLPKPVMEQVGLTEESEVELEVREGAIVITAGAPPRSGWSEAARDLATRGEDQLTDRPTPTEFDEKDWTW